MQNSTQVPDFERMPKIEQKPQPGAYAEIWSNAADEAQKAEAERVQAWENAFGEQSSALTLEQAVDQIGTAEQNETVEPPIEQESITDFRPPYLDLPGLSVISSSEVQTTAAPQVESVDNRQYTPQSITADKALTNIANDNMITVDDMYSDLKQGGMSPEDIISDVDKQKPAIDAAIRDGLSNDEAQTATSQEELDAIHSVELTNAAEAAQQVALEINAYVEECIYAIRSSSTNLGHLERQTLDSCDKAREIVHSASDNLNSIQNLDPLEREKFERIFADVLNTADTAELALKTAYDAKEKQEEAIDQAVIPNNADSVESILQESDDLFNKALEETGAESLNEETAEELSDNQGEYIPVNFK